MDVLADGCFFRCIMSMSIQNFEQNSLFNSGSWIVLSLFNTCSAIVNILRYFRLVAIEPATSNDFT